MVSPLSFWLNLADGLNFYFIEKGGTILWFKACKQIFISKARTTLDCYQRWKLIRTYSCFLVFIYQNTWSPFHIYKAIHSWQLGRSPMYNKENVTMVFCPWQTQLLMLWNEVFSRYVGSSQNSPRHPCRVYASLLVCSVS